MYGIRLIHFDPSFDEKKILRENYYAFGIAKSCRMEYCEKRSRLVFKFAFCGCLAKRRNFFSENISCFKLIMFFLCMTLAWFWASINLWIGSFWLDFTCVRSPNFKVRLIIGDFVIWLTVEFEKWGFLHFKWAYLSRYYAIWPFFANCFSGLTRIRYSKTFDNSMPESPARI